MTYLPSSTSAPRALHPAARQPWADHARGIGIVLVVLGHVLGGLTGAGVLQRSWLSDAVYELIYSFHMPLFFLVSGVFIPPTLSRPGFLGDKARTILYPYVVWSLLQGVISMGLAGAVNHPVTLPGLLTGLAVAPIGQFWFLWALFALCVLTAAAHRAGLGAPGMLAVAVALWALAFYPPVFDAIGFLPRTVSRFAIYFALGIWGSALLRRASPTSTQPLIAATVLAAVVTWLARDWQSDPRLAPMVAFVGIGGVLAASYALGEHAPWLQRLGRWSLPIYVGHVMAAACIRMLLLRVGVRDTAVHLVLGVGAGIAGPAVLGWVRDRGHLEFLFTPPAPRRLRPRHAASPAGHA